MSTFLADAANVGTALAPVAIAIGAVTAARYARASHKEQLDHDRAMNDRSALRQLLDEVGQDVTDTTDALIEAENRILYLERHRDMLEELHKPPPHPSGEALSEEFKEDASEALDAEQSASSALADAQAALGRVGPNQFRLRMRLADQEGIVASHWTVRDALRAWMLDVGSDDLPLRPRNAAALPGHKDKTMDAFDEFLGACREWFKKNPAPPEP